MGDHATEQRRDVLACGAMVALVAAFLCATPVDDFDLGFVVATGREVLARGIPANEFLVPSLANQPCSSIWLLAAPLFAVLWDAWGPGGIVALKTVCVAAGFLGAFAAMVRSGRRPLLAAIVCEVAALAVAARFTERPGMFSIAGFGAVVALACSPGFRARASDVRTLPLLAVGSTAWAWLHAEWQLGVAAMVAMSLDWKELGARGRALLAGALLLPALLSFALLHPAGVAPLLSPWTLLLGLGPRIDITEYQLSAWSAMPLALAIPPLAMWASWRVWRAERRGEALFLAMLALLCVKTPRAVLPLAIFALPAAAVSLEEAVRWRPSRRIAWFGHAIFALTFVPLFAVFVMREPRGLGVAPTMNTGALAEALQRVEESEGPLLCSFGWASGLLIHPEIVRQGVVMDGRQEAYSRAYHETVYLRCMSPGDGWEAAIEAVGVAFYFEPYTMGVPSPALIADFRGIGFEVIAWDGNGRLMARGDVVEKWRLPVLEFEPGSIGPIMALGGAAMERAVAEFERQSSRLESLGYRSAAGRIAQARLLARLGRPGDAADALGRIGDRRVTQLVPYWQARAEVALATGDEAALSVSWRNLRRLGAKDMALVSEAQYAESAGDRERAMALLYEALEAAPSSRRAVIDAEIVRLMGGAKLR